MRLGPSLQRLEPLGEARHEGVVDGVVHVDALDADAQLAAVGGDALDGAGHGAPERRVGQHEQGVLAAELHGAALEALAALRRDLAAGRGGAGEHDEVGAVDERRAELGAAAGDHLEEAGGKPRLLQQTGRPEAGERRLSASGLSTTPLPATSAGRASPMASVNG